MNTKWHSRCVTITQNTYMLIIANITQKNEGKDLNLMSDVNLKKKDWESYFKEGNGMEWRQQNIR